MIVDAHMHVIPPAVVRCAAAGAHPAGMTVEHVAGERQMVHPEGYRYPLTPVFDDAAALLGSLDERGVDVALVSPAPPLYGYDLPRAQSLRCAALVNDGVAEIVAAAPDRLIGLATLPLASAADAIAELERAVTQLGLAGAELGPVAGGRWLDDPALLPVLQAAEQLDALLFVHPSYTGARPGLEDFYLTNLVGNPFDTGVCAARLILSGTLDRLPDLRLMLAHGGGHLPYQAGRLARGNAVRPELGRCAAVPLDYLDRFFYDTLLFDPLALRFLTDLVGVGRVLYGSDEPFDMRGDAVAVQLAGTGLDAGARRAVEGENAAQILELRRRAGG